jgi:hypothetical protein
LQSSLSKSPFGALACTKGILENTLINTVDDLQKERKTKKTEHAKPVTKLERKNPKGTGYSMPKDQW